ncbi:MAG: hypothetical protein NZ518_06085 [Dehalococcoidia bacterium]|nr:hypothetical protein [Dehalococcoidia bacterium]
MTTRTPAVSIVSAIDTQRARGEAMLVSILSQHGIEDCEVLLADFGADRFPPPAGAAHPSVTYLPMRRGLGSGEWRAQMVAMARAPVVAFLEEHARALPGWLAAMRAGFAAGADAVGGPGTCANGSSPFARFNFLMTYGRFMDDTGDLRVVDALPGHNTAYRRDTLLAQGADLPHLLDAEWALTLRLRAQQRHLLWQPSMRWSHLNELRVSVVTRGLFLWNVLAGATIPKDKTGLRRWLWIARIPAIPPVRLARWIRRSGAMAPSDAALIRRNLLTVLWFESVATVGQLYGALPGTDRQGISRAFHEYEMNADRGPDIGWPPAHGGAA